MPTIDVVLTQTISLLLSIGLLGFLGFVFREYIRKAIDYYFKSKLNELAHTSSINLTLTKSTIPFFLELNEVVYKTRNYLRAIISSETLIAEENSDYIDNYVILSESIARYRAVLSKELFDMLHDYKRINQDILVAFDFLTRPDKLRENRGKIPPDLLIRLKRDYQTIEALYQQITEEIQGKIGV